MPAYDLLIFDWDGTLSDSPSHIVAGMQQAIKGLGLPPREDRQIAELIGLGMIDGLGRLYPELDLAQLLLQLAVYRQRVPATAVVPPLFAGAADAVMALHDAGYRLAVATGRHRDGLNLSLAKCPELAARLETTRCADESADKPDPRMLRQILDATGVDAARALMIGDTEYDMAMAMALGIPALGVSCGVHQTDRLRQAGASAVIENVAALPRWLDAVY